MVYQELIDQFEEENPDIKVEMQLTPWDQFWTKFDSAAGTDEMPDTFFMNPLFEIYAEAGIMEPLNEYIERDSLDMSVYTPAIVDYFITSDSTAEQENQGYQYLQNADLSSHGYFTYGNRHCLEVDFQCAVCV